LNQRNTDINQFFFEKSHQPIMNETFDTDEVTILDGNEAGRLWRAGEDQSIA
jgi:hypothetical protein